MFQSFRFNGLVIAQLTYMATKKGAFCKKCVTLVFSEFDLCVGEAACLREPGTTDSHRIYGLASLYH